ncbi:hypothetical protein H2200_002316 [Cladophialophora chaetospira]|uniref:Transmembrane protein n=1 Tax=Cladophialophora chaetospira TaxID=386627 RepID=A0AA39CNF2_9EURO|nr:hypothetical protein H2200_002316 [Cladophialophora chaetospira]
MKSRLSHPLIQCLALLLCIDFLGSSRALAQSGDGGGAQGVEPGDIGASPGTSSTDAGAEGPDTGSVNLSRGATIAISVVVSVVVILGGTMAVLFFLAKKRQWTMKETIRRSARKVTNVAKAVVTPLTPKKMTFSPVEKRQRNEQSLKRANDELIRSKSDASKTEKVKIQTSRSQSASSSDRDLEKGLPESAVKVEPKSEGEEPIAKKDKKRPRPPSVSIPSSAFEMDSPKTPVWKKVFGR